MNKVQNPLEAKAYKHCSRSVWFSFLFRMKTFAEKVNPSKKKKKRWRLWKSYSHLLCVNKEADYCLLFLCLGVLSDSDQWQWTHTEKKLERTTVRIDIYWIYAKLTGLTSIRNVRKWLINSHGTFQPKNTQSSAEGSRIGIHYFSLFRLHVRFRSNWCSVLLKGMVLVSSCVTIKIVFFYLFIYQEHFNRMTRCHWMI